MPIYNLIEYGGNFSKTFGSSCQYFRNETAVNGNGNVVEFNAANRTNLFKGKEKIISFNLISF